jgi:hypothetical protein
MSNSAIGTPRSLVTRWLGVTAKPAGNSVSSTNATRASSIFPSAIGGISVLIALFIATI